MSTARKSASSSGRRIAVRVSPRARTAAVEVAADGSLAIRVTEPPEDGRANAAVIRAVAQHFGVPARAVRIAGGFASRRKVIEIAS